MQLDELIYMIMSDEQYNAIGITADTALKVAYVQAGESWQYIDALTLDGHVHLQVREELGQVNLFEARRDGVSILVPEGEVNYRTTQPDKNNGGGGGGANATTGLRAGKRRWTFR